MSQCTHCGTTILFGGVQDEGRRFCNEKCHEAGVLALRSQSIPPEVVAQAVAAVVDGACPVCGGPGPVDVFTSYRVYSAVAVTAWRSLPRISCRGCATKAQLGSTLFSLLLGWWGIPWGFVMTPIQIVRNLAGLSKDADRTRPSKVLETLVRMRLASEASTPANPSRAA
jgi:hypothetical protein